MTTPNPLTTNCPAAALFSPTVFTENEHAPKLRRYARAIAFRNTDLLADADDYEQEAYLHLLLHNVTSEALSLWLGTRRIKNLAQRELAYRKSHRPMPIIIDEEGNEYDLAELLPAPDPTPEEVCLATEEHLELRERLTLATALLTPSQQQVLTLLQQDLRPSEIAERMGVSRARVSQHLSDIRATFTRFDLKPL